MSTGESIRVFIAFDTPPPVKRRLAELREEISGGARDVRWETPEKYHCTLQFLGNVSRGLVGALGESLRRAAAGVPPLTLEYSGIGAFPDRARPRVLWVGIRDVSGELGPLRERIARELALLGFAPEERPFHPHVTLGRAGPAGSRSLIAIVESRTFEHPPVSVSAVEIMQSVPGPRGTSYARLRSIPLEGRRDTPPESS